MATEDLKLFYNFFVAFRKLKYGIFGIVLDENWKEFSADFRTSLRSAQLKFVSHNNSQAPYYISSCCRMSGHAQEGNGGGLRTGIRG